MYLKYFNNNYNNVAKVSKVEMNENFFHLIMSFRKLLSKEGK